MNITWGHANSGEIVVHLTGCAHIKRDCHHAYTMETESKREIADEIYSDCIAEGSMDSDDALADVKFHACTKGLPTE